MWIDLDLPTVLILEQRTYALGSGIDEGWEGCGLGVNHTQHYANGTPAVRADFPDLKALVISSFGAIEHFHSAH